jgi:hypothetical protein
VTSQSEAAARLHSLGLIDPTDRPLPRRHRTAARLRTLNGKRAGFLDNRKTNGDLLLHCLHDLIAKRCELVGSVWETKFIYSREAEPAALDRLAEASDFVITAVGD